MKYITKKGNKFEMHCSEYQSLRIPSVISDLLINGKIIGQVNDFTGVEAVEEIVDDYYEKHLNKNEE